MRTLYLLMDSMNLLRAENADEQRIIRRACQQRDMLVTHLTALSGSARHLAALSSGESWWDEQYARKLRHALAEEEAMARLSFVRQVDGHLQVAYELHGAGSADEQAAQQYGITSRCLGKPMTIAERERAHVRLTEMPLMMVEAGAASRCIAGADICGDYVFAWAVARTAIRGGAADGSGATGIEAALGIASRRWNCWRNVGTSVHRATALDGRTTHDACGRAGRRGRRYDGTVVISFRVVVRCTDDGRRRRVDTRGAASTRLPESTTGRYGRSVVGWVRAGPTAAVGRSVRVSLRER